ncbi:MAG: nucleoside triphosphate pyrophosphatase [Candidatus Nealsonbacteria bacterium]
MSKIILASASPRRRRLLEKTGIPFVVEVSDYQEDMNLKLKPLELAKELSKGKAEAVAKNHEDEDVLIIGADTFVVLRGKILGKPHTPEKAKEMIEEMSGKAHSVITGFTVIDVKSGKKVSKAVESKVVFRKLNDREIDNYVRIGEVLDKAGAYAIQEFGAILIERTEGDYSNIVGLPLAPLIKELKKFGIKL